MVNSIQEKIMMKKILLLLICCCLPGILPAGDHPGLLVTAKDRKTMQAKSQTALYKPYVESFIFDVKKRNRVNLSDIGVLYYLTQDKAYAEAGKKALLERMKFSLDRNHSRVPQHCAVTYDFLEPSGVFTPREKEKIKADFFKMADAQMKHPKEYHNRYTDAYTTVGLIGLLFSEDPAAKKYIDHARDGLEWQLANSRTPDGAWPETPRYVPVAISRMLVLAKAFELYDGSRYLDDPLFASVAQRFMEIATPRDVFHGLRGLPGIGDAYWEFNDKSGSYYIFSWLAPVVAEKNPELAANLMWMWKEAGATITPDIYPNSYGIFHTDLTMKSSKPLLRNSFQKDIGYLVIRENFDTPEENYSIWHVPNRNLIHRMPDMGSFSIYRHNVPISLDSGAGTYGHAEHTDWFKKSASHNVSMFLDKNGREMELPPRIRSVQNLVMNDAVTSGKIDISREYSRSFAYLNEPYGLYIYFDVMDHRDKLDIVTNLLTFTKSSRIDGGRILGECYRDMELDIAGLLPAGGRFEKLPDGIMQRVISRGNKVVRVDKYPQNHQERFQMKGKSGDRFLVMLLPRDRKQPGLKTREWINKKDQKVKIFEFTIGDNGGFVIVNTASGDRKAEINSDQVLYDPAQRLEIEADKNAYRFTIKGNEMAVLLKK